nr:hypothetical protein [Anaerolineae bacterium]
MAEAFAEALAALRHAYERGELPIPPDRITAPEAYVAERLTVPVLFGDARLNLPPEKERAEQPLITLAEPPGPELVQIARRWSLP